MPCSVCDNPSVALIYESASTASITSMGEMLEAKTRVWLCDTCGHVMSDPLPDTQQFYADNYRISVGSDDEDQVYEVRGGQVTYRNEHQSTVFNQKVRLEPGSRVLDFGCAKATMMRRLRKDRPDVEIYLFDVSQNYESFWDSIAEKSNRAVHTIPEEWFGTFQLVTSYFSLEHITDPVRALESIHRLLGPTGELYAVVPYALTNIGDLIVVDHVNHFTVSSMRHALRRAGFSNIAIDVEAHRGALVVKAGKTGQSEPSDVKVRETVLAKKLGEYWQSAGDRLREAEGRAGTPAAVYGAGFYGMYVFSALSRPDDIQCFVDRSPYLQGKQVCGKAIKAPAALSKQVKTLYLAVNPSVANAVASALREEGITDPDLVFLQAFNPDV